MSNTESRNLDLSALFQAVTDNMVENRDTLNQADAYNHNHGDNMVEIFRVITEAMDAKPSADPADQLAYASELLREKSQSGSAQMYAQGLSQASQEFSGQNITTDDAMTLINLLLGGQPAAPAQQPQSSGNLLGSLLSSFSGSQSSEGQDGLDMNDLLTAGMSYMNSKQQGKDNVEAIMTALVSATQSGQSPHRAESGAMVAQTLMQVIGSMAGN
jgi:hypothetical protein